MTTKLANKLPCLEFERRAIEATAIAQEQLQCPVSFHPGRDAEAPFEIVRIYLEAGGKAEKCVMSHLDSKVTPKRVTKSNIQFSVSQERSSILRNCWNSQSWVCTVNLICLEQNVLTTN